MPADLISLIDTLTKLFIGAAMTWLALLSYGRGSSRSRGGKRLTMLEDIASEVGAVNHCFTKYSALLLESKQAGHQWPPARRAELTELNRELVEKFDALAGAEAKLLLMGEKNLAKTLCLYTGRIALFRKQVCTSRSQLSDQDIAELRRSIAERREQFYDLLSRRFDRLMAA